MSWNPDEFVSCARYGDADAICDLLYQQCQVSDLSTIPSHQLRLYMISKNASGQTALHMAAANGHAHVLQLITPHLSPSEVNLGNADGSTALHWASLNGHLPCVEILLEHGADATLKNASGRSALTLAEQQSHLEVAQILLKSFDPEEESDEEEQDEHDTTYSIDSNGNITTARAEPEQVSR